MLLSKRRREKTIAMNMTPMIDIVFLLIIFFMTVSQVSEINQERIPLPQQPGARDQRDVTITINVRDDGSYYVSGNQVTLAEVLALTSRELESLQDNPLRLQVVIRGDRRGDSRGVNRLVEALAEMQVLRVNLAVQAPDP